MEITLTKYILTYEFHDTIGEEAILNTDVNPNVSLGVFIVIQKRESDLFRKYIAAGILHNFTDLLDEISLQFYWLTLDEIGMGSNGWNMLRINVHTQLQLLCFSARRKVGGIK